MNVFGGPMAVKNLGANVKLGPRHLFNKLYHEADRLLFSKLYIDVDKDYRNTIVVAGSGRSGTTWLAQIINVNNDFRLVFEPFHSQKVKEWEGFNSRQYIRENDDDPKIHSSVEKILGGDLRNSWADGYNRKFLCKKRIVKEIRANLMLKYIQKNFPESPILFLVRHPCAVALSRMRLGWDRWDTDLAMFLSQEPLMEDYLGDFKGTLKNCSTPFEKEICFWAVENYVPLRQFSPGEILFVSYERLVMEPEKEFDRIFTYLSIEHDESVWKSVHRNTRTTWRKKPIVDREERVAEWKKELKDEEIGTALEILGRFGLDTIYDESTMPQTSELFE